MLSKRFGNERKALLTHFHSIYISSLNSFIKKSIDNEVQGSTTNYRPGSRSE